MHLVDVAHGFMGATGVVGGNVPLALGSALARDSSGADAVAVVFFGDGACRSGIFVESVNLARRCGGCRRSSSARTTASPSSRRAPAHTVVERVSGRRRAVRARAARTVDGNDVLAVRDAFARFPRRRRGRGGPFCSSA
jgi:pyruvate dehydrogenase E1 component alpha subunit